MSRAVRIANCSGFYGDRASGPVEMVRGGPIDVLTGDWLAELTLGLLAHDQMRDSELGYARSFPSQLKPVWTEVAERNIKVITNAGGLNPHGLAAVVREHLRELNCTLQVAVVDGDDITPIATTVRTHAHTGIAWEGDTIVAANAYLGSAGIRQALVEGADIVITGRVTDAALVIGAASWWHDWPIDHWHAIAGALAAGHIIECGCQATGGNHTFYEPDDLNNMGFPIAEVAADGSSVITKHIGTGGRVSVDTVKAQLLYEIQERWYLSPDGCVDLGSIQLVDDGEDRVKVSGAVGCPPPPTLKAGLLVRDGYRNQLTALIGGDVDGSKARDFETQARLVLPTVQALRFDAYTRREGSSPTDDLTLIDIQARDPNRSAVGRDFTAPLIALALASVPGLTFHTFPSAPKPILRFWPVLVPRDEVAETVHLGGSSQPVDLPPTGEIFSLSSDEPLAAVPLSKRRVRLAERVGCRSGDKGGDANVGLWVRTPADLAWLHTVITVEVVRDWLSPTGFDGDIQMVRLDNLGAVNILLRGYLDGGVAHNLAPDPQAKALASFFGSRWVLAP